MDIFPILRHVPSWVPGAGFQNRAKVFHKLQEDFRQLPYEETIRNIVRLFFNVFESPDEANGRQASGIAKPSFMVDAISNIDESGDLEHQQTVIKDTAGNIFLGGLSFLHL